MRLGLDLRLRQICDFEDHKLSQDFSGVHKWRERERQREKERIVYREHTYSVVSILHTHNNTRIAICSCSCISFLHSIYSGLETTA